MVWAVAVVGATLTATSFTPSAVGANPQVNAYRFGEGITLSDDRNYSLTLTSYVQPQAEVIQYLGDGPDGLNARFRLRRLRLRLAGEAPRQRISFRLSADLTGANEVGEGDRDFLLDAFVRLNITKTLKLTFGQRTTFTDNRELFQRSHALMFVERSRVTSAFAAIREFGFFAEDRIRVAQTTHYLRPYLMITNGDGVNASLNDRGGLKFGGRLDYLPFGLFYDKGQFRGVDMVRELVPRLAVGVAYSYNYGISSRRGRGSGDIIYLDAAGEESLPDFGKLSVDFIFKYRGFTMLGEFNYTHASVPTEGPRAITQRVRNDGSITDSFPGGVDSFVRGRMMLGRGYNIQAGYLFPFLTSVDLRYTHLDADEDSFLNNGTFYNRPNYFTVGVSQYFVRTYGLKLQLSATYVDAADGSNGVNSEPITGDEFIGRLMGTVAL